MKSWLLVQNGIALIISGVVAIYLLFFIPSVRSLYSRPDFIDQEIAAVNDIKKAKELSKEIAQELREVQKQTQAVLIAVLIINLLFLGVFFLNLLQIRRRSAHD